MVYDKYRDKMNAGVDIRLGDFIYYQKKEGGPVLELRGRAFDDQPLTDDWRSEDRMSSLDKVKTIQIKASAIGRKPSMDDRITTSVFAGTYRPMNNDTALSGLYYLFQVQKVKD